jgi:hypothetical protein
MTVALLWARPVVAVSAAAVRSCLSTWEATGLNLFLLVVLRGIDTDRWQQPMPNEEEQEEEEGGFCSTTLPEELLKADLL